MPISFRIVFTGFDRGFVRDWIRDLLEEETNLRSVSQLYECPVRRRYAWQLLRYGPVVRRAVSALAQPTQASAVGEMLRVAETETGHYPRVFAAAGVQWRDFETLADLCHFPALSRGELQRAYYDVFNRCVTKADVDEGWLGVTSGSTGEPVRFFMDGESIHFFSAFLRHLWGEAPLPRPWHQGVVLLCALPRSSIYRTRLPLFGGARFRKLHWAEDDALAALERSAPKVITGDPASLAPLLQSRVRPRFILSSAFALPDELARALREHTGATVVDYYSLAETGPLAYRCSSGGFHVLSSSVVEVDAGEIVITNLRNRLFPLVRYRTGDLGVLEQGCACGHRGPTISAFLGRRAERFVNRRGERVDPSQLQPLLSKLPVRQFRLEQRARGSVTLTVHGPSESFATDTLAAALGRLLDEPTAIEVSASPELLVKSGEKPIVYRSTL